MNSDRIFDGAAVAPSRFDLPRLLRGLGAGVIVASLTLLLFQNWSGGSDLDRYLLLLGETLLLAIAGVACGRLLREPKGARTFLMLAVAAVPVNFAILGAFIYSVVALLPGGIADLFTWSGLGAEWLTVHGANWGVTLPEAVTWRAQSLQSVVIALALGLPVLALVSLLGFMVLARRSAKALALLFIGTNALLLVPVREGAIVGGLLLVMVTTVLLGVRRLSARDGALRTWEGRIAQALLFVAPIILLGRSVWLYSAGPVLLTVTALAGFLVLRAVARELPPGWRRLAEGASVLPAAMTGLGVGALLADAGLGDVAVIGTALTLGGLLIELSLRVQEGGSAYRRLAGITVNLLLLLNLIAEGSLLAAFVLLVAGIATVAYAFTVQERTLVAVGAVAALAGFGFQLSELVRFFDLGGWTGLAVLGVTAVVAGSVIERHGTTLRARAAAWREQFARWEG